MKTARKFMVLTILLTVLLIMLFKLPVEYVILKIALGLLCLVVLGAFFMTIINWRRSLSPDDKDEIKCIKC